MDHTRCSSCFKTRTIEKFDPLYFIGNKNMCIKCGINRIKNNNTHKKRDYDSMYFKDEELIKSLCNTKELYKEVCKYCDSTLDDGEFIICSACEQDGCNYRI